MKETVHAFSWEPVGSKFAVIHGEAQALSVSFYGLKVGVPNIKLFDWLIVFASYIAALRLIFNIIKEVVIRPLAVYLLYNNIII